MFSLSVGEISTNWGKGDDGEKCSEFAFSIFYILMSFLCFELTDTNLRFL